MTADLYSSLSTETWEEFFSFSKERLNELKAGLRTAWHESNFADAEEFDKIFDVDAAGVMLAKPVIENFIESGAYAGLTDEEASASLEGKLLLAGVSVGVSSMIVGAFLTFGVWSAISLGTAIGIAGVGFGAAAATGAGARAESASRVVWLIIQSATTTPRGLRLGAERTRRRAVSANSS